VAGSSSRMMDCSLRKRVEYMFARILLSVGHDDWRSREREEIAERALSI